MAEEPKVGAGKRKRENNLGATWVLFVIFMVVFLAGIYVFSWGTLQTVWPFAAGIVLILLSFFIPMMIMGRSDTGKEATVNMDRRDPYEGR